MFVALAECKSRYCMILVPEDKKASSVPRAVLEAASSTRKSFKTVTCDNGKEFALHEDLSSEIQARRYFVHPYHLSP